MNINSLGAEYKENVSSKYLSTYKGGGKIKYVFYPVTIKELREVVNFALNAGLPFFILGNGSNILVRDKGYGGIAICLKKFCRSSCYNDCVYAEAGVKLSFIYQKLCLVNGLSGFERLHGIPSTVGGAIIGNAGAFGTDIGDITEYADVMNLSDGKVKRLNKRELGFGYRSSMLKNGGYVVLGASFKLDVKPAELIVEEEKRVKRIRKESQPDLPSLGSVFLRQGDIFPAKLIEACGLKGYGVGGAKISERHANFIVNNGNGTASDYIRVMEKAESMVRSEFGVALVKEIKII